MHRAPREGPARAPRPCAGRPTTLERSRRASQCGQLEGRAEPGRTSRQAGGARGAGERERARRSGAPGRRAAVGAAQRRQVAAARHLDEHRAVDSRASLAARQAGEGRWARAAGPSRSTSAPSPATEHPGRRPAAAAAAVGARPGELAGLDPALQPRCCGRSRREQGGARSRPARRPSTSRRGGRAPAARRAGRHRRPTRRPGPRSRTGAKAAARVPTTHPDVAAQHLEPGGVARLRPLVGGQPDVLARARAARSAPRRPGRRRGGRARRARRRARPPGRCPRPRRARPASRWRRRRTAGAARVHAACGRAVRREVTRRSARPGRPGSAAQAAGAGHRAADGRRAPVQRRGRARPWRSRRRVPRGDREPQHVAQRAGVPVGDGPARGRAPAGVSTGSGLTRPAAAGVSRPVVLGLGAALERRSRRGPARRTAPAPARPGPRRRRASSGTAYSKGGRGGPARRRPGRRPRVDRGESAAAAAAPRGWRRARAELLTRAGSRAAPSKVYPSHAARPGRPPQGRAHDPGEVVGRRAWPVAGVGVSRRRPPAALDPVGALPGEAVLDAVGVGAAEVAVGRGRLVDRAQQVEVVDDRGRAQVEDLGDRALDLVDGHASRCRTSRRTGRPAGPCRWRRRPAPRSGGRGPAATTFLATQRMRRRPSGRPCSGPCRRTRRRRGGPCRRRCRR